MIKGIGHLGLFVKDIDESLNALSKLVEFEKPTIKEAPEMGVKAAVVDINGIGLEFIQDHTGDGGLAQMINEKGDMIHHFCLLTDNIEEDLENLKQRGVEMLDQAPRVGLRGKKIAMSAPSALNGISIELSEP
ncbi:MAG: VOC family protein [Deltaproteobacteria bacterium]|nr:VOC family protein [Deltaproteobacteria bacterium]MBW2612287.1 VOC family protein [Deltaproteobacteria bacterium]MBW2677003.1 VOC family protein [Deltaproteobacteria bacterium]